MPLQADRKVGKASLNFILEALTFDSIQEQESCPQFAILNI